MRTMKEQAQLVADNRRELYDSKGLLTILKGDFNAEHAGLLRVIELEVVKVSEAETTLREMALAAFEADPTNKKPGPGVGIRDSSVYVYRPEDAFEWAKEHGMCLKLDEGAYKALLKAGQAPGTVTTEPVATIATDLAKALEGEAVPQ